MTKAKNEEAPNLASAINQAQSIIAAAEERANQISQEAEAAYTKAKQDGYNEGYQQGRLDASTEAVRLIEDSTAVGEKLSEEAAKLGVAIAEQIIGEHVKVKPDAAKSLATKAIQESVVGETVLLLVSAEDEKQLTKALPDLQKAANGAGVSIEVDESLTRGGCLVRTEFGEVDASVEALLESVRERLGLAGNGR